MAGRKLSQEFLRGIELGEELGEGGGGRRRVGNVGGEESEARKVAVR